MKMQALMRQHNTPGPGAILANGPGVHKTLLYFLFLTGMVYEGVNVVVAGWTRVKRPAARRRQVRQHGRFNRIPNELSNLTGPCADYGVSGRVPRAELFLGELRRGRQNRCRTGRVLLGKTDALVDFWRPSPRR